MNSLIKKIILVFFAIGTFTACTDDDDDSVSKSGTSNVTPDEMELITTVQVMATDTSNNSVMTFEWKDTDGDGGNAPVIDTIRLNPNQMYPVSMKFLDESDPNDVEDITVEISTEDDEHLICFESMNASAITITRTDSDGTYEIGLTSEWLTNAPVITSLKVTLKHQPDIKDGTCAPGEADVEISYPLYIQ